MRHPLLTSSLPAALLLCALAGCVSTTPELDRQFGHSVATLNALQTVNPEAGRNNAPVSGIDGKAAASAYDAYQKSYKTPEPQTGAFTIGIGSR